jgi:hypothetical protein
MKIFFRNVKLICFPTHILFKYTLLKIITYDIVFYNDKNDDSYRTSVLLSLNLLGSLTITVNII